MERIESVIAQLGGVARSSELARQGVSRSMIAGAVRAGGVVRVRKGWFATTGLPAESLAAARVGGAAACVTAARLHGIWVPPDDGCLHVAVRPSSSRLRNPLGLAEPLDRTAVTVHWTDPRTRALQALPEAIATAARCRGPETAFVLLESAMHKRLVGRGERALLNTIAPGWFRAWSAHASGRSESGTESLLKLLLISMGLPFAQQVDIADVGRVDFVVGQRLVIEVDSRAHHSDPYRDRKRDAVLSARGFRTLRFMYAQVVYERAEVEASVAAAVARGDLAG
jgi:very-short-patch-repair endonuclease